MHAPDGGAPAVVAEGLDAIPGEKQRVSWGVFPLRGRDALYVRWNGGGGWGDPIARDPEAVAADVSAGLVSAEAAENIYGVVLKPEGGHDVEATEARRAAIRAERLHMEAAE